MDKDIKVWLYDIQSSISEIESYFIDRPKEYEQFVKDVRTKRAIERNIEIIGESVNRILKKNNAIQITNARKIVDTRNYISHGYDKVSDEMIWGIVIKYIPKLKTEISDLLATSD